jgi:hypothetical protein
MIVNEFHAAGDTQGSSSGRRWPTPRAKRFHPTGWSSLD